MYKHARKSPTQRTRIRDDQSRVDDGPSDKFHPTRSEIANDMAVPVWWIEARFPSASHPLILRFGFRPTNELARWFLVVDAKQQVMQIIDACKAGNIKGKAQNVTRKTATLRVVAIAQALLRIEARYSLGCLRMTRNKKRRGKARRGF